MKLPKEFEAYTEKLMGSELYAQLLQGLAEEPHAFVRTNPFKGASFAICGSKGTVEWYEHGHWFADRPNFTFDPLLHAGVYYVQEKSSMFLAQVLRQHITGPVTMLDMCAAPGGKSTLARVVLPAGSLLVCNEPVRQRAQVLSENVQKCGIAEVIVTNNYPEEYCKAGLMFDVILCDVPCSGEGMFRKDANAIKEWSIGNVDKCSRLQREIVRSAWECLRPGGLLVYSTCTFNAKENEENVQWICKELKGEPVGVDSCKEWNICGSLLSGFDAPVYRFIPRYVGNKDSVQGEGLFMAVLRKPGGKADRKPSTTVKQQKKGRQPVKLDTTWLQNSDDFNIMQEGYSLIAIPKDMQSLYDAVADKLRVLHAGIRLGEVKGKDIVPDQSLALSLLLDREAFPIAELPYEQAIRFLRKEAVTLPIGTPKGFVLITYMGMPLGFEKHLGSRSNNLYPQEWRIKSTYMPDVAPQLYKLINDK